LVGMVKRRLASLTALSPGFIRPLSPCQKAETVTPAAGWPDSFTTRPWTLMVAAPALFPTRKVRTPRPARASITRPLRARGAAASRVDSRERFISLKGRLKLHVEHRSDGVDARFAEPDVREGTVHVEARVIRVVILIAHAGRHLVVDLVAQPGGELVGEHE